MTDSLKERHIAASSPISRTHNRPLLHGHISGPKFNYRSTLPRHICLFQNPHPQLNRSPHQSLF